MEFDMIGYRYSDDELGLLADIFGYEGIAALHIAVPQSIERAAAAYTLERSGILVAMGQTYNVDEIAALLVRSLCASERYLSIRSETAFFTLFAFPEFYLLAQKFGNGYVLKPAQRKEDIFEEIEELTRNPQGSLSSVVTSNGEEIHHADVSDINRLFREL